MEDKLLEQAVKAERLASCMTDSVTIERLMAFAEECRAKILDRRQVQPAWTMP